MFFTLFYKAGADFFFGADENFTGTRTLILRVYHVSGAATLSDGRPAVRGGSPPEGRHSQALWPHREDGQEVCSAARPPPVARVRAPRWTHAV